MTADELLAMPHNGYRYELVQGELRQMEFADRQHGRIAAHKALLAKVRILGDDDIAVLGSIIPNIRVIRFLHAYVADM